MELPLTRIGDVNAHFHDSETESKVQLVFVPGFFSPEAWKYQLNYFSEDYRTLTYWPTVSRRDFENQAEILGQIIENRTENALLIGAGFSNPLVQSLEDREQVIGTVLTGAKKNLKKPIPKNVYRALTSKKFPPKLLKKFFMPSTGYSCTREFHRSVDFIAFEDFQSFQDNFGIRQPKKNATVIHGEKDFLSSIEYARKLMNSASVSTLKAGSFSFYEKPQEFNKILNDFLMKIERKAEMQEVKVTKQKNRTLQDFEAKKLAKVER